jgi:hypothetical protein
MHRRCANKATNNERCNDHSDLQSGDHVRVGLAFMFTGLMNEA